MSSTSILAYLPSPPQGVWHLGPVPLRAYALCIIVGIVVAVWWGDRRWRARGGQPGDVLDVALWAVPFGLIGGRIYHVATDWHRYFGADGKGLSGALAIWDGGLGIWGAVFFGALGAWIGCRFKGIKLPSFGDAIAPAILLAQAIGRLGNYFNQELYGGPTTLPWGLELYVRQDGAREGIALPEGVSTGTVASVVHPTFLYEMLWNLLIVVLLVVLDRRFRIGHGRLFALYVAGYCAGRFWIELMRTDEATHLLGIRINLFTAAIIFLCAALYFVLAPRGRETGLSMYWPDRAEELAAEGHLGYVPPAIDDEQRETEANRVEAHADEVYDPEPAAEAEAAAANEQTEDADQTGADTPAADMPAADTTPDATTETTGTDEADSDAVGESAVEIGDALPAEAAPAEVAAEESTAEASEDAGADGDSSGDDDAAVQTAAPSAIPVDSDEFDDLDDAEVPPAAAVYTVQSDPTSSGGIEIREVVASEDVSMVIVNADSPGANGRKSDDETDDSAPGEVPSDGSSEKD